MSHPVGVPHGLPMERDAGPFHPPRLVTELRAVRPVSPMVFPDGHEGWLVTGYDAARQLLADTRFSSRSDLAVVHLPHETGMPASTEPAPHIPGMFEGMDPPEHTRLRRMLVGAFTVRRMKQLEEHIIDIVDRQLDEMGRLTPPVDLVKEFAVPVPSLAICELLGVPYEGRDHFQLNVAKFLQHDASFEDKVDAYFSLTTFLAELVGHKRTAPGEDILSDLARDDVLTTEELTGIAFLMLLNGYDPSASLLALGTFALLENPKQLADLRAKPDLLPGAVEELERYLAPADIFLRYATEDLELGGEAISRGSTVVVSLRAANRDPEQFEDADTLDIHRAARGHLSFGHGVHHCLGRQLARIEICAGLGGLLRRFPTLKLAIPAAEVKLKADMINHAVHELPVTWTSSA